jgi:hypothetical protein
MAACGVLMGALSSLGACSCSEDADSTATAPPGAGGGGGAGGEGGAGGGDGGGGAAPEYGPPATGFVSAGGICESKNFKMVFTMGQSTIDTNTSTSSSYRMRGGLIGATGSLP